MDTITVRRATTADYHQLRELEQKLIEAERPFDPTIKPGHVLYYDLNELLTAPHICTIVAETGGRIVSTGYGRIEKSKDRYVHDRYLYIGFIYTEREYRGMKLYESVINELKRFAAANGIHELYLEVYAENEIAIRAYRKIGFQGYSLEMRLPI